MSFFKRHHHHDHDIDTDEENDENIDPELRLRTVRTAASAIAESIRSEQRAEHRKTMHKKRSRFFRRHHEKKAASVVSADSSTPLKEIPGVRRNVYVNYPLAPEEVGSDGEPKARYVRNKVRTTKYTILTFIPKNLYEQFRRVANLFFLSLVILQLFPVFGAAAGSIAVLPLAFILTVTAIKDGIEDYRRGVLDEEVNTSAATKLSGGWKNVNQPADPRSWFEKLLGINPPGKVSKGVRKLREREAGLAGQQLRMELKQGGDDTSTVTSDPNQSSIDLVRGAESNKESGDFAQLTKYPTIGSLSQYQQSVHSRSSIGVVDWRKPTGGSAHWERTLWKKLEVGDIVLLRDNDQVPADIVVLSTSDSDGMCYLETKNLDGETNLKPRKAIKATSLISSEEDIQRSSFYLDSEPPHQNLYLYNGVLRYKSFETGEEKQEGVTINELLLRGCALRNTNWVIGLVVFTGSDTKIMLNGGDTPSKRSKIEKETNFNVIVNFCLLTIMCLIAAINNGVADAKTGTSAQFYEVGSDPTSSYVLNAIITFASCLIAFQNIVPISLYISIEIVKTIQAYFISQDIDMYYAPYDTPCVPKTWNISDDLGQIEYIFSDKTGTLTQNVMEFQKCSIHGVAYGEGITEAQRGAAAREGKADVHDPKELNEKLAHLKRQMISTMERTFKNRYLQPEKVTLVAPKLAEDLADRKSEQRGHIIAFFRALALCHTVLADRPEPTAEPCVLNYKAESPDEAALVSAARDAGFPFIGKMKDGVDIEVMGQTERYTLLKVLEFNSTRKRMSVIVRAPDGRLILYCKGADSVIYTRLSKDHNQVLKEQTSKDMETFANNGLRTLCIAYRYLEEDEYLMWVRTYDAATSAVENRDEEIEKANEMIEHSLIILGATALEDKLQEGVPEAIEMLHRAGIKLWILTGDKLQTAIEIGYSCNLLKNDMDLMILSADTPEKTRSQIEAGLNKIASILGPPSWDPKKRGFVPGKTKASFAVVIDGDTLRHALTPDIKPLFLNLGTQCETVVCCRVSPAQKALTVNLVCGDHFDATYLYQYTFILLYNLVFTSLPVIVLGAFDQDINATAALAFPQLYVRGIRGLEYTRTKFWLYMGDGLYQSAIVFFIPYLAWTVGTPVSWNGKGIDSLADFGTTVAVAAIFAANTYVGLNTHYWTIMTWIVVVGSTLVMLLWILVYSFFMSIDFVEEVLILFGGITFWATVLVTVTVALAPRFIVKFVSTVYYPLDKDILREMWVMGDLKDRLGIKHRKQKKNRDPSSNLEAAPMFHEQHSRSMSELSVHNAYEPTEAASPATPQSQHGELSPSPMHYLLSAPKQTGHGSLLSPPTHFSTRLDASSPQPSYYSASDIPPSSPLPPTQYRLASGEITTTPPTQRTSLVTRNSFINSPSTSPPPVSWPGNTLLQPPISQGATGLMRRLSGGSGSGSRSVKDEGVYEMRVRSPPAGRDDAAQYAHGHGSRAPSATSYTSFTSYETAADESWTAEDEHHGAAGSEYESSSGQGVQHQHQHQNQQPYQISHASSSHERSSEETARGEDHDGDTVMGHGVVGQQHDRRTSAMSVATWEMGRA
ncbi:Phospholipid-transporting ATPase DNF1 [Leucoagaricus sp. SymC.cos]|nr:Phospholipid-transporting ATPase DNF1 [Leucoagaricus sp. SymC.cos]